MYTIVALCGKAGSGKDTMLQSILKEDDSLHEIISFTTRPPREEEADGINYYFISGEQFGDKVLHGEMIEATNFRDWFYGTGYDSLRSDKINVGVFNPAGIDALNADSNVTLYTIYILASDKERFLRQLNRETEPDVDEIIRRYKVDAEDFCDFSYDMAISNNTEKELQQGIHSILATINSIKSFVGKDIQYINNKKHIYCDIT